MTTIKQGSSNDWYTPADVIASVRLVLGEIDLDPASCAFANETVGATRYFTKEDNGLMHPWYGRIFCNPPYGKTVQGGASYLEAFSLHLVNEYELGHVQAAILLIPTNTDTSWFAPLWQFPICFPPRRIHFLRESGPARNGVSFGTCLVYLGPDIQRFTDVFQSWGHVAQPSPNGHTAIRRPELWQLEKVS